MVKTGYISFTIETGGGQDADGNTIASTKTPSEYFPCNLKVVTKQYLTVIDGQTLQASYSVYIDSDIIFGITIESVREVLLQDNKVNPLGTFQIQNIEYLELSKKIKIVV